MSAADKNKAPAHGGRPGGFGGPPGAGLGIPVQKAKNFKGTLRRLVNYLRPSWSQLMIVFGAAIVSTIFNIVAPKILGRATTRLFVGLMARMFNPAAKIDFGYIGHIMLLLLGLYVISAIFGYIQQWFMAGVAQETVFRLRRDASQKLGKLPLKFYDTKTHGEIMSRFTNDVDVISNTLQQSLAQVISSFVTLIGVIVMMLTISPLLTLITVLTLPLSGVFTAFVAKRSQKFYVTQQKHLGEMNGHVEEMFTGHKIVKAFGMENDSIDKFNKVNENLYDVGWKAQFISGILMPVISFVGNLGYVLVSVVGGVLVVKNAITIGDVQAFIQYSRQFTMPIIQVAQIANIIQSTVAAAERVFELLDEEEEVPEKADPVNLAAPLGAVRFESVEFGYKPDEPLMKDLDIDIKPGQTIAIVGPTGAGKTTLVNLLMRFYDVNGGKITVDGTDVRDLTRHSLRNTFGMVLQDTWLFNGTVEDNIAYGRPGATHADVLSAAKAAHADHFVRTLPEGYKTVLNEEASNISQGQRQLLTIARAVLADPAILILDEATSSVDTRTELQIQKAMIALMKGRTSFVIAHRLSTIRDADLILVMNHGSVIEKGTHHELLDQKGFYAELYNSQFEDTSAVETA